MGSVEKADLHSEWGRGQRHGRPPGFARQVHGGGDSRHVRRREDDRRRSEDAQRVSLPARARSGSGAARRRAAAAGGPGGRGRGPQGPIVAAWFIVIKQ